MIDRPSSDASRATAAVQPGGLPRLGRCHRPAVHWAAAALALGLAACGGDDDAPAAAATNLAINAANADRVAGEAIHSFGLAVGGLDSVVADNFVLEGVPATAALKTRLLRAAPAGGGFRPQAVSSSTSAPCATSGQSTITLSQAAARKLAVGDFAEVQFDACVQIALESVGKAREVVTAVNATQTVFEAHGELTGFGSTDAGVTTLETGPYDLSFDRTNAAFAKISSSSDKAINVERRINQRANAAYSLTALKRSVEGDVAANAILFKFSYTASGSFPVLGATRFQIDTPQNLALLAGGGITGAVKVAGVDGSSLLLTFLGDNVNSVRLDLDANGDGTIDQTQTRTADALLNLVLAP
jgi:hypothetical protein